MRSHMDILVGSLSWTPNSSQYQLLDHMGITLNGQPQPTSTCNDMNDPKQELPS